MKKTSLLVALSLGILLTGCGQNKVSITDSDFGVESCNKYFRLMDCILENDKDETYTDEMRNAIREEVKVRQEEWKDLDKETLNVQCSNLISEFSQIENALNEIGCSAE